MTWSKIDYPEPMRRLHEDVRSRAINIANQLVADGMDESMAIQTAIDRAEAWVHHRGEPSDIDENQRHYKDQRGND